MVSRVPAPDGLLELADDLARIAANIRAEVASGDAAMAEAYATTLMARSRVVHTGVLAWSDAQPQWAPNTNPYGPITLHGSSTVIALQSMGDDEVFDYYRQLEWAYIRETRPAPRGWLDRARRQARDEVRRRPGHPDV